MSSPHTIPPELIPDVVHYAFLQKATRSLLNLGACCTYTKSLVDSVIFRSLCLGCRDIHQTHERDSTCVPPEDYHRFERVILSLHNPAVTRIVPFLHHLTFRGDERPATTAFVLLTTPRQVRSLRFFVDEGARGYAQIREPLWLAAGAPTLKDLTISGPLLSALESLNPSSPRFPALQSLTVAASHHLQAFWYDLKNTLSHDAPMLSSLHVDFLLHDEIITKDVIEALRPKENLRSLLLAGFALGELSCPIVLDRLLEVVKNPHITSLDVRFAIDIPMFQEPEDRRHVWELFGAVVDLIRRSKAKVTFTFEVFPSRYYKKCQGCIVSSMGEDMAKLSQRGPENLTWQCVIGYPVSRTVCPHCR